jgi:hypothetical protein
MVVGRLEDLPEFPDLLWVVEIDIRIAKVEIQSGAEIRLREQRSISARAYPRSGSTPQSATRRAGNCLTWSAVQSFSLFYLRVFVLHGRAVRIPELVGKREDHSSVNARRIHLGVRGTVPRGTGASAEFGSNRTQPEGDWSTGAWT